jgi:hypothetical protein
MSDEESKKTVVTVVPDRMYHELLAEARAAPNRTIYETFAGDTEPTKIWLVENDTLMSQMPPEPFEKKIIPASQMEIENMETGTGRGDLIKRLVMKGLPKEVAVALATKIYTEVPLNVYMRPEKIDDLFRSIVRVSVPRER